MGHDAKFVQRWLPIEEDDVSVYHVSFHHVTKPQLLSYFFPVSIFQKPKKQFVLKRNSNNSWAINREHQTSPFDLIAAVLDKVGSGVNVGAVPNQFSHQLQVGFVHLKTALR